MLGGSSASQGIVLYDTALNGHTGILCYYDNGVPCFKSGPYKSLIHELEQMDQPYNNPRPWSIILIIALEVVAMTALIYFTSNSANHIYSTLGAVLFCLISFFPIMSLAYSTQNHYSTNENSHRFRRNHAAEHKIINCVQKHKTQFDMQDLRRSSKLHRECGMVYMGSLILFAGMVGSLIANLATLGLMNVISFILLGGCILILNILNPFNPLILLQLIVTEEPTDAELLLVYEGMSQLIKLDLQTESKST
jgi:uncharacterized protein YqhQ